MKYRTKIYLNLSVMAFLSTVLALGIVYFETKHYFFKELQSKVISIAASTAAVLDPELLKQIRTKEDENSPAYKAIADILRKERNANHRNDVYVKYIFTEMPSPDNPKVIVTDVTATEDPEEAAHTGDIDPDTKSSKLNEHLNEPYSPNKIIRNRWGAWLTGYVPVHDAQGKYVATVAANISAAEVQAELNTLIIYSFIALGGSLLLALVASTFLAKTAAKSLNSICTLVDEIKQGNLDASIKLETNDEFRELAQTILHMAQGLKERQRLKTNFGRYVSRHVLDKILKSEMPIKLEGERRKVTVLFSDLRQFTKLAEKMPPESVVALLNEYFEQMMEAIFGNQGTLDKFIGDAIMVEFGAPLEDANQEKNAVLAAIAMQRRLKKLSEKWVALGKPKLEMGIGIHTGQAVVGNIGSEERMEYTAVGDTVNIAERLEQASKVKDVPILISEETFLAIANEGFTYKKLGPLSLPGRSGEIIAYAIYP